MRFVLLSMLLVGLGADSLGAIHQDANPTIDPVQETLPDTEVTTSRSQEEGNLVPVEVDPSQAEEGDGRETVVPAVEPGSAAPSDVKPLIGFGHELWIGAESGPIVRVLGSGAPELFVQVEADQTTVAQVGWLQELGDSLEATLGRGQGTIHLLVDSGQPENEGRIRPLFDTRSQASDQNNVYDIHAVAAKYLDSHPHATHRILLAFPEISEQRIGFGSSDVPIRSPGGTADRGQFQLDTWEDFVRIGLGIGASKQLQVASEPRTYYRLQGETEWMSESDGNGPGDAAFRQANAGKILETCPGTRSPTSAAKELIHTLENLARIRVLGDVEVTPMGGELWQVELLLGAPTMQIEAVDPLRTYPRDSFGVLLDWGPSAGAGEGEEEVTMPSLAYLAWQPAGQDHFELLPTHKGAFRFPGQGIPEGARLRFGVQASEGAGKLIGLALNSRLHGEARIEFIAPSRKAAAETEEPGDRPAVEEGEADPVKEPQTVPATDS